jgi:nickel-dependent lactate racemase
MLEIEFGFGKTGIAATVPDGMDYQVIESRSAKAVPDEDAALEHALDVPVAGMPLQELAAGKKSAAISLCDITRPVPNSRTLPHILKRLHAAGIPVEGVTILIATGLHRAATAEEIQVIVGPEIAAKYRVVNHDATNFEEHRFVGETSKGVPAYIDRRFLDAELHITLGFIEQHLMLGFSGGRKLIAPGVAAQETIKVIHSPKFMREPLATEGSIEDNPLHAQLLEIAALARHDFMLDVTLTQTREISGVFAGEPVAAHRAGVEFLTRTSLEKMAELADVVITSAAGHPLDLTFYQTIKGVTAAQHIVKPGGRILILGECSEGVGSAEFREKMLTFSGFQSYLDSIRSTPVITDQWQLEKLALVGLKNELYFYVPGVKPEDLGALAPRCYASLDEAVAAVLKDIPAGSNVALVPEGPYVFARVAT